MPWTIKDVDGFKKGLSDKQKRQWVSVANATLAKCLEEGGSDCEASAIKQANASVGKPKGNEQKKKTQELRWNAEKRKVYNQSLRHLMSQLIREDTLDGKDCWVIPTILICEGVHNGVFYPAEQLATFPQAWNGIPAVIDHPKNEKGEPVTANSKEILENQTVGKVLNVYWDDPKLHGEVWIYQDKLDVVDKGDLLLMLLKKNEPIEVSTGLFTEDDGEEGLWDNEEYECMAIHYRPDHLALLPDSKGACSWEDGGGMPRVNERGQGQGQGGDRQGDGGTDTCVCPECGAIKAHERGTPCVNISCPKCGAKMTGQSNNESKGTEDKEGKALSADSDSSSSIEKTGPKPNQKEDDMDRKKKVDELIANEQTAWTDEDREYLMGIKDDERFEKLTQAPEAPKENTELEKPATAEKAAEQEAKPEETEKPAEEKPAENKEEKPQTLESYLNAAPAEVRETISRALRREQAVKARVVEALVANEKCPFSADELKAKTLDELEKLAVLAEGKEKAEELVDYSGRNAGEPIVNEDEEVPNPTPLSEAFAQKS